MRMGIFGLIACQCALIYAITMVHTYNIVEADGTLRREVYARVYSTLR